MSMNVTFRQLRLFLALVETGSVSAAARAMHVTQPTASMQLKEIRLSLGVPLYEVIGKKIFLTEVGKELAGTSRTIFQSWDSFEQGVDEVKGLSKGKLKISVVSTAKYFMPRILGMFCIKHPSIDVSLEVLNRDGVVKRLRENLDDLYIMSTPPIDIDIADQVFMPNPIVVIASNSDKLIADKYPIGLKELSQYRFVLREKGSGTRMAVDSHFRSKRFRPDIRLELGSNEAIKESVAGGLGLGIVSRHALHGHQKEHGVSVINVEHFPILSAWHIVHPMSKQLSPLASAFKKHLLKEMKGSGSF